MITGDSFELRDTQSYLKILYSEDIDKTVVKEINQHRYNIILRYINVI